MVMLPWLTCTAFGCTATGLAPTAAVAETTSAVSPTAVVVARLHVTVIPQELVAVGVDRPVCRETRQGRYGGASRVKGADWQRGDDFAVTARRCARGGRLPARRRSRDGGVPGSGDASTAVRGGRRGSRQDRARAGAGRRPRRTTHPVAVLRGHRRGAGALRLGLPATAAAPACGRGRGACPCGRGRGLRPARG